MRSQVEIDAEIKTLEEIKPNVRQTTAFGDDNHAAIEAQLEVLRLDVDDDEFFDKVEDGEWSEHERESAQQAFDWLMEENDANAPSDDWKELVA